MISSLLSDSPSVIVQIELEFGGLGLCGGRKTEEPGEKNHPGKQGEKQQQNRVIPVYWTDVVHNIQYSIPIQLLNCHLYG